MIEQGPGSGLDADTVDEQDSSELSRTSIVQHQSVSGYTSNADEFVKLGTITPVSGYSKWL